MCRRRRKSKKWYQWQQVRVQCGAYNRTLYIDSFLPRDVVETNSNNTKSSSGQQNESIIQRQVNVCMRVYQQLVDAKSLFGTVSFFHYIFSHPNGRIDRRILNGQWADDMQSRQTTEPKTQTHESRFRWLCHVRCGFHRVFFLLLLPIQIRYYFHGHRIISIKFSTKS